MPRPTTAVETYFEDLRRIRASGGATGERSAYTPLANLLTAVGAQLKSGMTDEGGALGDTTFGIYLNDRAYWRNVPAAVWGYKLGGSQVLKKWLSYRERKVLGRPLRPEEVQHFTDTARRIAAILLATGVRA